MTDINGYRADGGALGQDQGLSKQLKAVLTPKMPLLNAPGRVWENVLYYDADTADVTAVEMQNYFAKDRISANVTNWGSTHTFTLNPGYFCGNLWWVGKLNKATYRDPLPEGADTYTVVIPHGWSFFAFAHMLIYMGGGNIPQLQISAYANYFIAMACCETQSKRQEMLTYAGYPGSNYATQGLGSYLGNPTDGGQVFSPEVRGGFYRQDDVRSIDMEYIRTWVMPVRTPWSSMVAIQRRLSLDLKLISQPISIVLETKPINQCIYISNDLLNHNTQLRLAEESTLQAFQQELSDKSMSVRNELLAMPEFNVALPTQLLQGIPFVIGSQDQYTGAVQTDILGNEIVMNITSLINSDLTTMLFAVVQNPGVTEGRNTFTTPFQGIAPCYGERLEEFELLLNGQQFFRFWNDTYGPVQLCSNMDSIRTNIRIFSLTGESLTGYDIDSRIYELNFGRLRSLIAESSMQNTPRFLNMQFQLKFKVNRLLNWPAAIERQNRKNFTVQMVYCYNSVYLIGGDGGNTKLITA